MASQRPPRLDFRTRTHCRLRECRCGVHPRRLAHRSHREFDNHRQHHEKEQDPLQELEDRGDIGSRQRHLLGQDRNLDKEPDVRHHLHGWKEGGTCTRSGRPVRR